MEGAYRMLDANLFENFVYKSKTQSNNQLDTPWKFNIAPENKPSQQKISSSNHHF